MAAKATSGELKIMVVGADDLERVVKHSEQQPYYVLECGHQRSRSKPSSTGEGVHPVWNTAHRFVLTDEMKINAVIKDDVTKALIGQGVIELARACQYGRDEGAVVLINLGGEPAGMLRYKLKFKPGPAQRTSEAGSFVSCEAVTPSPRLPPTALASGNGDEHDATLASVSSKVSLARKAMAALTEELAELTGMDGSASGTPVGGGRRAPRLSTGSLSPLPSSPGAGVTGWRTPTPGALSSVSGGAAQEPNSIGQLLALYVGTDGVEQPLPDVADFEADARALVEMLQDALVAAHTEKVSAAEELSNVKQAMAMMSRQHYMEVKRLRDGTSGATSSPLSGSQSTAACSLEPAGDATSSPPPAHRLHIQLHQKERQLAEATAAAQAEATKREALAQQLADLQARLDKQTAATRQAEANARAAETKAAQQATLAAAASAKAGVAARPDSSQAALEAQLADARSDLAAAQTERSRLETALSDAERSSAAELAKLQSELRSARDAARGSTAAAASSNGGPDGEEVEYLQAQLRRTLRQVVELQHQMQVLQSARAAEAAAAGKEPPEDTEAAAIRAEHESLMQELVASKLELALLKEKDVRMQRQLLRAQDSLSRRESSAGGAGQ